MYHDYAKSKNKKNRSFQLYLLFSVMLFATNPLLAIDSLQVHWSTYIGGSEGFWGLEDYCHEMAIDDMGNLYVVGETRTSNLPNRTNEHPWNNTCAYAAKLGNSGAILWSTYVGGTSYGQGYDITIDQDGEYVYITGHSDAIDLPGVINPGWGSGAFVTKLSAANGNIEWTRFLTTGAYESIGNALFFHDGFIYVAGYSRSYELLGAENEFAGGNHDTFISKLAADGTVLKSTWLGGSARDLGKDIFVDNQGNMFVVGQIADKYDTTNYNLPGAINKWRGDHYDGFVCKLNPDFAVLWSRYVGGKNGDDAYNIIGDTLGNLWIAGKSYSDDMEGTIIVPYNGYSEPGGDGFLTKISADGTVDWTSYAASTGSAISKPMLTQCRKIITLRSGYLLMFDADLGYHQWLIDYDNFMGPHCYSAKSFHDIFIDEAMNIYVCGFTSAECSNYPNRTNEHSGQGYDGYVMKTNPKGYFFHFNQTSNELPSGWITSTPDAWSVKDGKLTYEPQGDGLWLAYLDQSFFNYNVQVECTKTKGNEAPYGLVFKDDPNSDTMYNFNICIDNTYYVDMTDDGQSWQEIINVTSSPYIKGGLNQCNVLKIAASDSIIKFYCNGGYLNKIKIDKFFKGCIGLFVLDHDVFPNEVEFDNFCVGSYTYNVTDVEQNQAHQLIPVGFNLFQNYPNPFNSTTAIQYTISKKSKITIKLFNLLGEEINTLVDIIQPIGSFTVHWDGKDRKGLECTSGLYICSMKTKDFLVSRKLMLLR